MVANSWRVTKKKDPVVQMVPHYLLSIFYGYHTKKEIFYNTNSDLTTSTSYKICTGNEASLYTGIRLTANQKSAFSGELIVRKSAFEALTNRKSLKIALTDHTGF